MAINQKEHNPPDLKQYLDKSIRWWRKERDKSVGKEGMMAECYVDAFQSVRSTMLGETLEEE